MDDQIRTGVLTISDSRAAHNDLSGDTLTDLLTLSGISVIERSLVSDDSGRIVEALLELTDRPDIDLVITTGGTGFGPRDNTPEATLQVIDREARGMAEAMRRETAVNTPFAMLSRGVCGIRGSTLIINLPGSPKAVGECLRVITPVLAHAIDLIAGKTRH